MNEEQKKNSPEAMAAQMEQAESTAVSMVNVIESEFDRAVESTSADRAREKRNWGLYFGVALGQFTEEDKAQAALEGRNLATFNVVTQKCDSLNGYILKNQFDADFVPVEKEESEGTQILKSLYLSDKNMMDWDSSYARLVTGGLNYQGVEEMYVDRKFHPLGNIAFRAPLPGHVIFDPRWKTDCGKDCQMAWVVSYLTASQIAELFPNKVNSLRYVQNDIEKAKEIGEFFDSLDDKGVTPLFDVSATAAGYGYYRIIRKFEMVTEEVMIEYDKKTGKDLPTGTDYASKLAFLNRTNPEWEPDQIGKRTEKRRVCMVTTVCRQLDTSEPLERKPSEIQIGRLPLFGWSALRQNGQCRGIVDLLADIQYKINYREELITSIIETEACGAKIVDPMLFNDDQDLKDKFEKNQNQPNKTIWTAPGATRTNKMPEPISRSQLPQDIRDQLVRMWEYADRISKAPAVFDARTEKSGESGYLFAQKARVAEQQSYTLFESLKRFNQEKAEAYMEQAKIQYTIGGIMREFVIFNGEKRDVIVLNKLETVEVDGVSIEKIENDLSTLSRHKVVISESPVSTTNRLITRALASELLRVIPQEAIGTRQVFTSSIVESLDTFSAKDKEKLEQFRAKEEKQAMLTLENSIIKLEYENFKILSQYEAEKLAKEKGAVVPPQTPPGQGSAVPPGVPPTAPIAGAQAKPETGTVGSLEGGPVPPEKSQAYTGGGPQTPAPTA